MQLTLKLYCRELRQDSILEDAEQQGRSSFANRNHKSYEVQECQK